jgi:hypothetical protein
MTFLKSLCFTLALGALASEATAAMPCSTHAELVKLLGGKYGESLSNYGVAGQRNLVEVYVSEAGSFTILATKPDGISCIIATGQNWERAATKNLTSL